MKIEGILPIGSVVLLKEGSHRVMIIGYCQKMIGHDEKLYDYVACLYPEGFMSADQNLLFNQDQVDIVYNVGYQTDGQFAFARKVEDTLQRLRANGEA